MSPRLRRVHQWCGLILCLFYLLQALSGLMLVYRNRLLPIIQPYTRAAPNRPALPLDELVGRLKALFPDRSLERIVYPEVPGSALTARYYNASGRDLDIAYIDPSTGNVISCGSVWKYPLEVAEEWHLSLMSEKSPLGNLLAEIAHMVAGLVLIFLAASGPTLWWPGLRRLRRSFTIHWRPRTQTIRDLHVIPGIVLAVFFATTGTTAALILYGPVVGTLSAVAKSGSLNASSVVPRSKLPVLTRPEEPLSYQAALDRLRERFPDDMLNQLRPRGRTLEAVFYANPRVNPRAFDIAIADRLSGRVLVIADNRSLSPREVFEAWLLPVHGGFVAGPARPFIMAMVGLGLIGMAITGPLYWYRRTRLRKKRLPPSAESSLN